MSIEIIRSMARNTSAMMGSQIVTWISSLVLFIFLPRYLGTESYGQLFLAMSLALIAQSLIDFGGPFLVAKEISRSPESAPSLLVNSLALRAGLWIVSAAGIVGISFLAGYPATTRLMIFILITSKLWEGAGRVLTSCFQGFEQMHYPAMGAIAERVTAAVVGVAALMMGAGAVTIAVIYAMSTLLNTVVQTLYIRRILPNMARISWRPVVGLFLTGLPYLLCSLFAVLYYRVDAIILSIMTPALVVGWYGAAYRVFDILMFLPSIYSAALFPVLSKTWASDRNMLSKATMKSLDYIILSAIPLSIGIFFFAKPIVSILFGLSNYAPSVEVLQILAIGLPVVYIDFILISTIMASDRTKQWIGAAFAAMLINPLLNLAFIPVAQSQLGNGGVGAAIATLVTEFLVLCMAITMAPKEIFASNLRPDIQLRGLACGVFMIGLILLMRMAHIDMAACGLAGLLGYLAALVSTGAVPLSDIKLLSRAVGLKHSKTIAFGKGGVEA